MSSTFGVPVADSIPPLARARPLWRAVWIWSALAAFALFALLVAVSAGSSHVGIADILRVLLEPDDSSVSTIVHQLRLPRAIAAFATGGLLATAGALMQVLLRNPLADPYILGTSGGAAVGALGAMLLGAGVALVNAGAFCGALLSVLLVFGFAMRDLRSPVARHGHSTPTLLLIGVILGAGWSALVTIILIMAPEQKLRGMLFWMMGDLSGSDSGAPALIALAAVMAAVVPLGRDLNVLLRGERAAQSMGVNVAALRAIVLAVASLGTAFAVTTAGAIGFIGLVVPHALRLVIGNDQRVLLPACALGGSALLVLADVGARTIVAPMQLPVGVITSAIGVPAFLYLLLRRSGR